ncbi:MAG TPA: NifB/NifX family molybdenum-iron cluster-binding protein [Anaerohalosphaeraceae bacterium]|nr:NifB/NifX family molybdenum-iron cluster-binding protein [Anaerohalosphaeraceae bacterium]
MKICITSEGPTLEDRVDSRFGRAAYFLLVDSDTMDCQVLSNQTAEAGGGVGVQAAKKVLDVGARAVLTGNCGPNAIRILQAGKVAVYSGVSGSVKQAIEAFKAGRLKPDTPPEPLPPDRMEPPR